jgi:hypothetical protein
MSLSSSPPSAYNNPFLFSSLGTPPPRLEVILRILLNKLIQIIEDVTTEITPAIKEQLFALAPKAGKQNSKPKKKALKIKKNTKGKFQVPTRDQAYYKTVEMRFSGDVPPGAAMDPESMLSFDF